MIDHVAVTSFSEKGWNVYGKRFVESFLKHWDIPLFVYAEGQPRPFASDRLYWFDLNNDPDRRDFLKRNNNLAKVGTRMNPNMQSLRFCHKIFALTHPDIDSRWRIWIDADTETISSVNDDVLSDLCPEDSKLVYLGRTQALWKDQAPYSECGFVAYRTEDPKIQAMMKEMRRIYTSDELYLLGNNNWHDSYVFDYCRKNSGIPKNQQYNLSAGIPGLNVWEHTILSRFMRHNKGERAKLVNYGGLA
jgi:hypothetical protein